MSAVEDTFVSHLVELRDRLIRALIAIAVVFVVLCRRSIRQPELHRQRDDRHRGRRIEARWSVVSDALGGSQADSDA